MFILYVEIRRKPKKSNEQFEAKIIFSSFLQRLCPIVVVNLVVLVRLLVLLGANSFHILN